MIHKTSERVKKVQLLNKKPIEDMIKITGFKIKINHSTTIDMVLETSLTRY